MTCATIFHGRGTLKSDRHTIGAGLLLRRKADEDRFHFPESRAVTGIVDISMRAMRPRRDDRSKDRRPPMTMQSGQDHHGFFGSAVGQMTLLGAGVLVVLLLGWRYVW